MLEETIAALSTPVGEGGIAVLRLSGPQALEIAGRVFRGRTDPAKAPSHTAHYGHIVNEKDEPLDEVVLIVFRAPRSYTGEDVVEVSCHGGIVGPGLVLESLLAAGARLAQPGEFTRRAFERGRLDLAQAEAVADLIAARSAAAHQSALRQLGGGLSREIEAIRKILEEALVELEAGIDLEEDELASGETKGVPLLLARAGDRVSRTLDEGRRGLYLRRGLRAAVIGRSNVGKSTLFNALLREDRSIVTEHAGTTRDTVEGELMAGSLPVTLADTAGLREARDPVERLGIGRSRGQVERADLLLVVLDGAEDPSEEDRELVTSVRDREKLLVVNKVDLPVRAGLEAFAGGIAGEGDYFAVSALTGEGIRELRQGLESWALGSGELAQATALGNVRHLDVLRRVTEAVSRAAAALEGGLGPECAASDINEALDELGEVTGRITTDDLLERIFGRFCVGK